MLAGMKHAPCYSHPLTLEDATAIAEIHVCTAASLFTDVFRVETNRPLNASRTVELARLNAISWARDRLMQASDAREYLHARLVRAGCGSAA